MNKDTNNKKLLYNNIEDWKKWKEEYGYATHADSLSENSVTYNLKDNVNHPSHYTWLKDLCGIEVIDITRHMDFDLGNSIKYILRCGHKSDASMSDKEKTIEDLKKAKWYIDDKIKMLEENV